MHEITKNFRIIDNITKFFLCGLNFLQYFCICIVNYMT